MTIGRDLCDANLAPPIKGLFIYNHNPLIVHPDQNTMRRGLLRDDLFTVACDGDDGFRALCRRCPAGLYAL